MSSENERSAPRTKTLGIEPDAYAPDGSEVRLLASLAGGSFAHFTLPAGATSGAVSHRTVEEIWYFVAGEGDVWRKYRGEASVVEVKPGVALTIPLGAEFQFRAGAKAALCFVAVTMPPWPGPDEAFAVAGPWRATAAVEQS
jgi:mannose-6-phosphate isomerase-like protein (cupin superfamily)